MKLMFSDTWEPLMQQMFLHEYRVKPQYNTTWYSAPPHLAPRKICEQIPCYTVLWLTTTLDMSPQTEVNKQWRNISVSL